MAADQNQNSPTPVTSTENQKTEVTPAPNTKPQAEQKQQPNPQAASPQSQQHPYSNRRRGQSRDRGWNRDVLYEKAGKLAQSGRVEFLDNGVYNVIGDHGTYTVALDYTGKISCNCPGYLQKGKCSHTLAVSMVAKNRHKR